MVRKLIRAKEIKQEMINEIKERKKLLYKSPLPKKKQRVFERARRSGPVRVYSEEEIQQYQMQMRGEQR